MGVFQQRHGSVFQKSLSKNGERHRWQRWQTPRSPDTAGVRDFFAIPKPDGHRFIRKVSPNTSKYQPFHNKHNYYKLINLRIRSMVFTLLNCTRISLRCYSENINCPGRNERASFWELPRTYVTPWTRRKAPIEKTLHDISKIPSIFVHSNI